MKTLDLGILAQRRVTEIEEFTFTITTPAPNTDLVLPLTQVVGYTHNFVVDWGDNSSSTITSYDDVDRTHTYAVAGNYIVKIDGICPGFKVFNGSSKSLITSIVSWGNVEFREMDFYGCEYLVTLPANEKGRLTLVTDFTYLFLKCYALTSIPSGLFDNNTVITEFFACFYYCTSLTSIPVGLFDTNTSVTSFNRCFGGCTSLISIPTGLFDNNPLVTDFSYCFFKDAITQIPSGLFDNQSLVTTFSRCFGACTPLTSIPVGLFDTNTSVINFNFCFYNDINLIGNAPELWNRIPEPPQRDKCFYNCDSLDNYGDIPANWK